jgi:hypothetical protein
MNANKALWEKGDFTRIADTAAGRATELEQELESLFERHNTSPSNDTTNIPATFLRVTVSL